MAQPTPPSGQRQDRTRISLVGSLDLWSPVERQARVAVTRPPIQEASNRAAERRPCWDRQAATARLSLRLVAVASQSPCAPRQAQPASAQQQPPLERFDREASNPAAARTPCWDRPYVWARLEWEPEQVAVREQRSAREAAPVSRPAPVAAAVLERRPASSAELRQRPGLPSARPALGASSPAAARTLCWDRRCVPVQLELQRAPVAVSERPSAQALAAVAQQRQR